MSGSYEVSPGWRKCAIPAKLRALTTGTREDLEGDEAIGLRAGDGPRETAR